MARREEPKIQPNNDLEKKIMEAFEVFDHSGKQVVDVREIGTILRSLGCCPTEAEIQEVILATENKEATGNVPLVTFLPYMCKVMIEHRFYPASAEMLLAAFKYFDSENRGYLSKERFTQLMLEEGEPFTQVLQPNNDLEKKIMEAFEVFDHSGKQVVDVREIGTILRSLGCCPTEAEIQEVILATENKEATGNVPLVTFLPYMCKVMIEHRFYPASAEMLLAAFKYFDSENRGYLSKERFTQLMLEEGEPFTQEEFDEMMQTALDPVTDTITYEYYINQLMVAPKDAYDIADAMEAERKRIEAAAAAKKRGAADLLRAM